MRKIAPESQAGATHARPKALQLRELFRNEKKNLKMRYERQIGFTYVQTGSKTAKTWQFPEKYFFLAQPWLLLLPPKPLAG